MADTGASYPITVWSGVLTAEHYRKIGPAVWEFLWLIDRTTGESQDAAGVVWGMVLGGKPIQADECATQLGKSTEAVLDNWRRLELAGYIRRTRAPYGYVIEVHGSKKWRRQRPGESENRRIGESESGTTPAPSDSPDVIRQGTKDDKAIAEEGESPPPDWDDLRRYVENNRWKWAQTPHIAMELTEVAQEFSPPVVRLAVEQAIIHNADAWSYVRAILDRWRESGVKNEAQARAAILAHGESNQAHRARAPTQGQKTSAASNVILRRGERQDDAYYEQFVKKPPSGGQPP